MEIFEEENARRPQVTYLVFAVDGTAATGPYWKNIFSDYLEKIIRYISRKLEQNTEAMLWLGLVVYKAREDNNAGFAGQAYEWTRDVNKFLEELLRLEFGGGDSLNDAGIADGLNEALVLYPKPQIGADESLVAQYASSERHCVLVAASDPFMLPTQLQTPVVKDGIIPDFRTQPRTVVVDDVAKIFAECSVSLSVISPKHLPSLKQIFNVGNGMNEEVASTNYNVEYNPHEYLVLLSEKFPDIHSAFKEEQMMMMRSPSPASVEARANYMEMEANSGNQITDEVLKIMEQILDGQTTHMQEDHIYPHEAFTIMPGITPQVPNGLSNGFTTTITSTHFSDSESSYDEDRMRYEAIIADNMGATQSNLDQDLQTLMTPAIGQEETPVHEDGFWATQEPRQNFMSSTSVQTLEPKRLMMPMEIEENMAPPLMITEILPNPPQFFYNFMPEELEMLQTVRQTSGQVTTDSVVVSSLSSIDSDFKFSQPVGLQTAYTGQLSSQPVMLLTGVGPGAILEGPQVVTQPVPGSLTGSETPSLSAYLRVHQSQAADSGLAENLTVPLAETPSLPENLCVPQATDTGSARNLMVPLAETPGLPKNLSVTQAADSLAGNLTVSLAETPGLPKNLSVTQAVDYLAGNLMVPLAETPGLPNNLSVTQAADSLAGNLTIPLAETPGLPENVSAPQASNSGLAGNLRVSQATSFGFLEVLHSRRIDEELQPKTAPRIVGEQGGSDTEMKGGQSFETTIASVIERHLGFHGGMNAVVLANLDDEKDGYVLSWQGNINAEYHGESLHFGQAKAYRKLPALALLTADWPQTISVDQVLRLEGIFKSPYTGEVDIVVFAAVANQQLFEKLKKNNYCLRMNLSSKTMIFFPTERNGRFFGALFCGHSPSFLPDKSLQQPVVLQVLKQEPDVEETVLNGRTTDSVMHKEDVEMP